MKYKAYLEASNAEIPRSTCHRHDRKRNVSNKENSTKVTYKRFMVGCNIDVPRTSTYRKRKILQTLDNRSGVQKGSQINNTEFQQPSERFREMTTRDEQNMELLNNSPLTLDQTTEPREPENHLRSSTSQTPTNGENWDEPIAITSQVTLTKEEHRNEQRFEVTSKGTLLDGDCCDLGGLGDSNSSNQTEDALLYPGASVTKGQSLLLLMAYILRHSLTGTALEHLLKMFNELLPGSLPATSYLFHKAYGKYGHYETHFYCSSCTNYIGSGDGSSHCSVCQTVFDRDTGLKNGSYFLVLSLSSQLKDILENPEISLAQRNSCSTMTDIHSGKEYQKLIDSGKMGSDDISLIWNCDGIPVFRSSKCQLWPIQCQIIELKPNERKNNICIPCIWFGEKKPNIITLLTPFVEELQHLEKSGLKWTDSTKETHCSKVFALICSSDSVARPQIRNTKQFNGEYGCDFCYHKGGGTYSYTHPEPPLREESEHYQHAMAASPSNPVMGVKGPSPLMKLENFKMISGFVPEYQHSVCLGVTRQLATLWLESTNHKKPWYIGTKTETIDKNLLAIKPPKELIRVPRSVKDRKFWKASEWRSFLLFYALPVLNGILSKKYWNHFFLLVFGIYTLLQEKVDHSMINQAESALKKFVQGFEKLYGKENMTFNVHLMTHISTSVMNWGPLWATSTFSFESFNGTLLKYFNGTTHVDSQIVKRFLKWRDIANKANEHIKNAQDTVKELFYELQHNCLETNKSLRLLDSVRVFGNPRTVNLPLRHLLAVEELFGFRVESGRYFERFIVNDVLYHSHENTRLQKRQNCFTELADGTFCKIIGLIAFDHCLNQTCCVLVKKLRPSGRCFCRDSDLKIKSWFIHEVTEINIVHAVHIHCLIRKCVMINYKNEMLVTALPNNMERD